MTRKEVVERHLRPVRCVKRQQATYGENVTELQHALQSATFARNAGENDSLVAATLLHDYGHLLHDLGEDIARHGVDARHEELGARALEAWFGPEVVEPGRLHVAAKRYLCRKHAAYLSGLVGRIAAVSPRLQGGPMSAEEAGVEFERQPAPPRRAWKLRLYDDMGKVPGDADAGAQRPPRNFGSGRARVNFFCLEYDDAIANQTGGLRLGRHGDRSRVPGAG